jgi:serine/threonine protein kinase
MKPIRIENGSLLIDSKAQHIGDLVFDHEIARGANGIVFKATDPILQRSVAIKIWLTLNTRDRRDKYKQGLHEARKTWKAKGPQVAELLYSGTLDDNTFFTVMEYIEGSSLRNLLQTQKLSFGMRANIAEQLVDLNEEFIRKGLVHGDLHWNNVMLVENFSPRDYFDLTKHRRFSLKIIDFGTSYYSGESASLERNHEVLIETIDKCISPFKVREIKASEESPVEDSHGTAIWLRRSLYAIRAALFELGYEFVGWPLYRKFGTYELTTIGFGIDLTVIKERARTLIQSKTIKANEESLGASSEWGSFDGRYENRKD